MNKAILVIILFFAAFIISFAQSTHVIRANKEIIKLSNGNNLQEKLDVSNLTNFNGEALDNSIISGSVQFPESDETLNYLDSGTFNTNFGFFDGNVMMQYFEAPASMIVKAAGFSCSDASGSQNANVEVRLLRLNWTYDELTSIDAPYNIGVYPQVGDGMGGTDPFGENATGSWIDATNGAYPLPPWTNNANPNSNNFNYDLWSDGGFGWPITAKEAGSAGNYQWVDMSNLFEPTVKKGEIFAVALVHRGTDPSFSDRIGFYSAQGTGIPGWKYYEEGRIEEGDGWWVRDYTWDFAVAVEYLETPVITSQPEDIAVNEGESAEFSVTATSKNPIGYQWWKAGGIKINNTPGRYSGATTNNLTIYNVTGNLDDQTEYVCEVYNTFDPGNHWINSESATLTVNTYISLISPNGSEVWQSGSKQNILWTSSFVSNAKLEYSINDGASWQTIVGSTPSDGSYEWNVPNLNSNLCLLRISKVNDASVNDISASNFTIYNPTIDLISPDGGENWISGNTESIQWTSIYVDDVKLEYSQDNGTNWISIISSTPSDGSFSWNLPKLNSNLCLVKISSTDNNSVSDRSSSTFTVSTPSIDLISPNGEENWTIGSVQTIEWNSNYVENVKIEYSANDGSSWILITSSTNNDGDYNWTIPNNPSTQCRVRIQDISNSDIYDISSDTFTIKTATNPSIELLSPNGGEVWYLGSSQKIKWNSEDVENINIQYSVNSGANWEAVATNIPSSIDSFLWVIPNTPSSECLVTVVDANNSDVFDVSDNTFEIFSQQIVTISISAETLWYDENYDGVELGIVDASGSKVNFGKIESYTWTVDNDTVGFGATPTIELPTGTNEIILTLVTDLGNIKNTNFQISLIASKFEIGAPILSSVSSLDINNLFITSMNNGIYKFDSTGASFWNYETAAPIPSTVCVSDESNIYVGSSDRRLYSVDNFGTQNWAEVMGGAIYSSPSMTPDKNVCMGLLSDKLVSINSSGEIIWTLQTEGAILSSPSISENTIYFGGTDNKVYAVSLGGEVLNTFVTQDSIVSSPALGRDGSVIIGAYDGYLYKFDENLNLIWKFYTLGKVESSPVIDEYGNIYVGSSSGFIYALTKENELLWKYDAKTPVNGNLSIGPDGSVYIGCNDGRLLVLSNEGKLKWYLQTENSIIGASLVTNNNLVYVGSTDGNVYIMKAPNAKENQNYDDIGFEWPTFKGNNKRTGYIGDVVSDLIEFNEHIPSKYSLMQNFPNPFNPSTKISCSIPVDGHVTLMIYDIIGNVVDVVENGYKNAGVYSYSFNASNLSSGIYFYTIKVNDFVDTKKMVLIK